MSDTEIQAVDTPAPDANVPDVENVADPSTAPDAGQPKGVGKRIDELTRNWREAERREATLLELLRQRDPQPRQENPKPAEEKLKTLADFEYDDAKYQSYIFDQAEKRSVEAARRELSAERERETATQRKASFVSRSTEFAKTVEDYDSVVRNPRLHINADMAEVIEDSDDGPALAYHLGKNPDVADRIAQLPPKAAARELGKIEARLAFEREKAKPEKVSKAPPPPPKVEGTESSTGNVKPDDPDSDKLSDDEWARRRNKQVARRS